MFAGFLHEPDCFYAVCCAGVVVMTRFRLQLSMLTSLGRDSLPHRGCAPCRRSGSRATHPHHVTLCREDDFDDFQRIERPRWRLLNRLAWASDVQESFGGQGLLLSCREGLEEFSALRRLILYEIKNQHPHITLAHPRNPKAYVDSIQAALTLPTSIVVTLPAIHLIRQQPFDTWQILRTYKLRRVEHPSKS